MELKSSYLHILTELKEVRDKHHISHDLFLAIEKTEKEINSFIVKIPVIGGFNAGKSSLINAFLHENVLPVEITPETAIAAEIKYGDNKVVAHKLDGETQTFPLEQIRQIDANTYKYIEVYMENKQIHQLGDMVLVDMPGFDSGIAEHNKAIFQYLKEGVVFIIVVDCEDGSVKSSVLNFLYELDLYQLNYAVIVNKIDQKPMNEISEIVGGIKNVIASISDGVIVETASARMEGGNDGFVKAVHSFDKEAIFKKKFQVELVQLLSRVKMNLEVLLRNSDSDADEIKKRIRDIEKKMKGLDEKLKQEEVRIQHKIRNEVKSNILRDVQAVLYNESSSLALSAKAGSESFNQKVNELIRPVLVMSTNKQLELTFSELVAKMSGELVDVSQVAQGVTKAGKALEGTIARVQDGLEKLAEREDLEGFLKKYEKLYKVSVGSLAIVTGVVAPWLELIIFFLPDILKVFGIGSEERQLEKIKEQLEANVIPNIIDKIGANIDGNLESVKENFLQELKKEVEAEMQNLAEALKLSIDMKEKKENEFAAYIDFLKADIARLEKLRENIQ
ncbi:dynamin family protein [Bacillus sp. JJ1474]|uniref:dynamin family protein n=1 Tax=Bacillus sp. JJ1474 TaxID=3122955 RepID=UPI002FFF7D95